MVSPSRSSARSTSPRGLNEIASESYNGVVNEKAARKLRREVRLNVFGIALAPTDEDAAKWQSELERHAAADPAYRRALAVVLRRPRRYMLRRKTTPTRAAQETP